MRIHDDEVLNEIAAILEAMGEPVRLRLLQALLDAERTAGELWDEVGGSQANVSKHLARLRAAGFVGATEPGSTTASRHPSCRRSAARCATVSRNVWPGTRPCGGGWDEFCVPGGCAGEEEGMVASLLLTVVLARTVSTAPEPLMLSRAIEITLQGNHRIAAAGVRQAESGRMPQRGARSRQ